jgi:Mg2+ and Co2+ transporter CorA
VDVRLITENGVERRKPDDIGSLIDGPGLVWIDVAYWDATTEEKLVALLGLHPRAAHDCAVRNPLPKAHVYPGQVFVVLHGPERGARGHVHYVELDQYLGPNWVITVHGPMNPAVQLDAAYVETGAVARRLEEGRLRPGRPCELSAALVGMLTGRLREFLTELTQEVWQLERQVTGGHKGSPEAFLEELFGVRHGLLAVRTMAAMSREVYGRMSRLAVFGSDGAGGLEDLEDQFRRIAAMAESQREYLQGVIEFYRTKTDTKMAIAAERLAVIAAVTLPITALSSILGMNVIVYDSTHWGILGALLVVMGVMSLMLLIWARRQGCW